MATFLWDLNRFLPALVRRRLYLHEMGFAPAEIERTTFTLARSRQEREQAFRLLHEGYQRRGIISPRPSGLKLSIFSLLPSTTTFLAILEGRVVGTMSMIEDTSFGLPMDETYLPELGTLRERKVRIGEVGALVVRDGLRRKGIAMMMFNLLYRWVAEHRNLDSLVIAVHPRILDFYKTVLLFEAWPGRRAIPSLQDAPAVGLRTDVRAARGTLERLYGRASSPKIIGNMFQFLHGLPHPSLKLPERAGPEATRVPRWEPDDLEYFLDLAQSDGVLSAEDAERVRSAHALEPVATSQRNSAAG